MADEAKTVFISYRRSLSSGTARAIFQALKAQGYDVFMDVESIDSGQFDAIILRQIAARMHFILVLQPGSLDRAVEPGDWLAREIQEAIRLKRNIVPILAEGFTFDSANVLLQGDLAQLPRYNGLNLYHDYFDGAIEKLTSRFLKPQAGIQLRALPEPEKKAAAQQMTKVTAPVLPKLTAPVLRLATPAAVSSFSLKDELTWQPVTGATRYVLERSNSTSFFGAQEVYRGADTAASVLSGWQKDARRYYRVKAQGVNLVRESDWSNTLEAPALAALRGVRLTSPLAPSTTTPTTRSGTGRTAPEDTPAPSAAASAESTPFYRRFGWWAAALLVAILTAGVAWLVGWGADWLVARFQIPLPFTAPGWLLPVTGAVWGVLYLVGAALLAADESEAENQYAAIAGAVFGPYGSMFDESREPGFIGSILCAPPLNFILTFGIALALPAAARWVGSEGLALAGRAPFSVSPTPVFWTAYGVLLLWGIVGYVRGVLDGWA
jgi:hypothetical protein